MTATTTRTKVKNSQKNILYKLQATIVFEKLWNAIHETDDKGNRKYKYIIQEGSSRSSKTLSTIDAYDLLARNNEGIRLTVWRDTKTDCKKTVLVDMKKRHQRTDRWMKGYKFNKTESIFEYSNLSTVEIHGTDDEETVHGLEQYGAWFNEPYKMPLDTFNQIDQRTSGFVILDWNPKKKHFIDDLKNDERAILIKSTFKDNPFCPREQKRKILSYQPLSRSYVVENKLIELKDAFNYDTVNNPLNFTNKQIKELIRCIKNHEKNSASDFNWSVYGLGEKAERPNRIFRCNKISTEEYNAIESTIYTGCDWGVVDPWGILDVKYYDGALYVNQRNYESENDIRSKLNNTSRMQVNGDDEPLVGWMFSRLSIEHDRIIICDTNRPLKIRALRSYGWEYAIGANKDRGSIIDGISGLLDLKIYYTATSLDFENEQEVYSRKVDRYGVVLEEPEDINNHLMDCLRYVYLYLKKEGIIK